MNPNTYLSFDLANKVHHVEKFYLWLYCVQFVKSYLHGILTSLFEIAIANSINVSHAAILFLCLPIAQIQQVCEKEKIVNQNELIRRYTPLFGLALMSALSIFISGIFCSFFVCCSLEILCQRFSFLFPLFWFYLQQ